MAYRVCSAIETLARGGGALPAAGEGRYNRPMQELIKNLLIELGEDPDREGLVNTPKRVAKAYEFLTSGYRADINQVLNNALFTVDYSEMVIVKDIDFYSLCEHHLLPFFGKCHVAYIPTTKVIGLSKIPRLVDVFARRLQVQERLTNQIADTIRDTINPLGVAVVIEATHLCMSMRGVEKQNSFAVTSAMLGAFRDQGRTRMEFLELIKLRSVVPGLQQHQAGLACIGEE
jgi:GTP cyclohydrolase I